MRPFTWAREITTATSPLVVSNSGPRIMLPPYRLSPKAPLNQGLVAKYIALPGMTGGRLWYDLCQKNKGTLTNMTSGYGWQGALGRPGGWGAMRFDGVDDYVQSTTAVGMPDGSQNRTIACWVNMASYTGSTYGGNFVYLGHTSGQKFIVQVTASGGNYYLFTDGVNPTNNITISGAELPPLAVWNHIAFTLSGSAWAYYLNGKPTKNGTFPIAINTFVSTIRLGSRADVSGFLTGSLDDVSIYNRALSAGEVAGLYEASKNQYRNEILCAWEV